MHLGSSCILYFLLKGLSVSSCLIRNDYNVLFSFLILILLNRFYSENKKFYSKILIHLLLALAAVDIVWLVVILPYWNTKSKSRNPYWESLSGVHTFGLIMAFLELFIKLIMAVAIFFEYRKDNNGQIDELLKFSYNNVPAAQNNLASKLYFYLSI